MKVVQILLSPTPARLEACVDSVRAFADRAGAQYDIIDTVPEWGKGFSFLGAVSDRIKLELIAREKEIFAPDWDILLSDDFELPDYPAFGDMHINAVWNAGELLPGWYDALIEYNATHPDHAQEYCRVPKIMARSGYPFQYLTNHKHLSFTSGGE